MNEVAQTISSFVIDKLLLGRKIDLAGTKSFLDAGIIDSTGVLELISFLEDTYGLHIEDADMVPANLDSLDNLVRFVARKAAS